jgi:topoisomerase-4 subunit B
MEAQQILVSQEIRDIALAIGVQPDSNDTSQLRYGEICILTDADYDGFHIATLLCALFLRHFRPLVEQGRIFVVMPPLYRVDVGKEVFYALDEVEKQSILDRLDTKQNKKKIQVTRFKGLGEMNPLQLRETTMDPNTRRLVQLTIEDDKSAQAMMDMLLAKKRAGDRRQWLESKGNVTEVQELG